MSNFEFGNPRHLFKVQVGSNLVRIPKLLSGTLYAVLMRGVNGSRTTGVLTPATTGADTIQAPYEGLSTAAKGIVASLTDETSSTYPNGYFIAGGSANINRVTPTWNIDSAATTVTSLVVRAACPSFNDPAPTYLAGIRARISRDGGLLYREYVDNMAPFPDGVNYTTFVINVPYEQTLLVQLQSIYVDGSLGNMTRPIKVVGVVQPTSEETLAAIAAAAQLASDTVAKFTEAESDDWLTEIEKPFYRLSWASALAEKSNMDAKADAVWGTVATPVCPQRKAYDDAYDSLLAVAPDWVLTGKTYIKDRSPKIADRWSDYFTARNKLPIAISDANRVANAATMQKFVDAEYDGTLTEIEKVPFRIQWAAVQGEHDGLLNSVQDGIPTGAYTNAYADLLSAVPYWAAGSANPVDISALSPVISVRWSNYWAAKSNLQSLVAIEITRVATDAQTNANKTIKKFTDAESDDILTEIEKPPYRYQWSAALLEHIYLHNAAPIPVAPAPALTVNYDKAYNDLAAQVGLWDAKGDTPLTGIVTALADLWATYFSERTMLQAAIGDKAYDTATDAAGKAKAAHDLYDAISLDNVISNAERPTLKMLRASLSASVAAAIAKADAMGVTHAALDGATGAWTIFNATGNASTIIDATVDMTLPDKAVFNAYWANVYKEIENLSGTLAKVANDAARLVTGRFDRAEDDGLLTEIEKPAYRTQWAAAQLEYADFILKTPLDIDKNAYIAAYNGTSGLTAVAAKWTSINIDEDISVSVVPLPKIADRWATYFAERTKLQSAISDAAYIAASGAVSDLAPVLDDGTISVSEKAGEINRYQIAEVTHQTIYDQATLLKLGTKALTDTWGALYTFVHSTVSGFFDITVDTSILTVAPAKSLWDLYLAWEVEKIKLLTILQTTVKSFDVVGLAEVSVSNPGAGIAFDGVLATALLGKTVLLAKQLTTPAQNGIYTISQAAADSSGGGVKNPTVGSVGTYTQPATDTGTKAIIFSGWTGTATSGTLQLNFSSNCEIDKLASGQVNVLISTNAGVSWAPIGSYSGGVVNSIALTPAVSNFQMSNLLVKFNVTATRQSVVEFVPGHWEGDTWVAGTRSTTIYNAGASVSITAVYLNAIAPTGGIILTHLCGVLDGESYLVSLGATYGGKNAAIKVDAAGAIILTPTASKYQVNLTSPAISGKVYTSTAVAGVGAWADPATAAVPVATATTVGTVKQGDNIIIDATGRISATGTIGATGAKGDTGTQGIPGTPGATGAAGPSVWGGITGSIATQVDLANALGGKQASLGFTPVNTTDSRLADARPASDVYAWAKATTKPGYNFSEIGSGPITAASATINGINIGTDPAQGSIWNSGGNGLSIRTTKGSANDFVLINPADNAVIAYVPTNTLNVVFGGAIGWYAGGVSAAGLLTAAALTDGYITWSAAQINRVGFNVELQYPGTGGVQIFGGTTHTSRFDSTTGNFTTQGITATSATINGAVNVQGNAGAIAGCIYSNPSSGFSLWAKTGTSNDFQILNPASTALYLNVPTGSLVPNFPNGLTATTGTFSLILGTTYQTASFISNWGGANYFGVGNDGSQHRARIGMTNISGAWLAAPGDMTLQIDGALTAASATITGNISSADTIHAPWLQVDSGASLTNNWAQSNTTLWLSNTGGRAWDFAILNPAQTSFIMNIPTGTGNVLFVDNVSAKKFNGSGAGLTDIISYQTSRDFPSGTFIQTNIDYSQANGEPFLLEIEGNSYGNLIPTSIKVQGYIYSGTLVSYGGISCGTNITGMVAMNWGGFLCFWFPSQGYWQGYNIFVNSSTQGVRLNRLVSVSGVAQPAGTKLVPITITQAYHTGNVNSGVAAMTALINLSGAPVACTVATKPTAVATGNGNYVFVVDDTSYDGNPGTLYRSNGSVYGSPLPGKTTVGLLSAGSVSAQAMATHVALINQVISSTIFTSGGAGVPAWNVPGSNNGMVTGWAIYASPQATKYLDGTTDTVIAEFGGNVSIGGRKAAVIVNRVFGNSLTATTETSWICPEGITSVELMLQGPGGAGGNGDGGGAGGYSGGGGQAGGYIKIQQVVTPLATYKLRFLAGETQFTDASNNMIKTVYKGSDGSGSAGGSAMGGVLTPTGGSSYVTDSPENGWLCRGAAGDAGTSLDSKGKATGGVGAGSPHGAYGYGGNGGSVLAYNPIASGAGAPGVGRIKY